MRRDPSRDRAASDELSKLKAQFGGEPFKPALADLFAVIERDLESARCGAVLEAAWRDTAAAASHVIGITGPPGVGKSTLIGALIRAWRADRKSVAVIAVDPSSRRSGGALLGDRTRFETDPSDAHVFVRSMAARGRLGGLAALTFPAAVLMRALFDIVVVESVGVGQSETDIRGAADTVALCVQPAAGDALQFMKAGVLEIADLVIVTKRDLGALAERAADAARGAFPARHSNAWRPPVQLLSVLRNEGIAALIAAMAQHRQWLVDNGGFAAERRAQGAAWLEQLVCERFGRRGADLIAAQPMDHASSPFGIWRRISRSAEH